MNYLGNIRARSAQSLAFDGHSSSHTPQSPKRILVTGGAGFLGSHLCETLLTAGHQVICLDNFSTGQRRNIAHLKHFDAVNVIAHDIVQPIDLEVDEIYNLACPASPPHYQSDPIHTTKTCVLGSLNLLELAARTGARILQASTSEVYGDPNVHPQVESYWGNVNPFGPRSCYDEGKRCAETLFFDFHNTHGVEIKIVRIFNTYGPRMRQDDGRVVSNFIVQALKGQDITIYGDGSQTRSFCFVDDLVSGIVGLMASPSSLTGPVNLGNPGEFTIRELAEQVIELTGSRSKIIHRPLPVDDPRQRRPDISLAMQELGWRPTVDLTNGLMRTIGYFDALLTRPAVELAEAI
ncbi:UDP-glucuronic acid decarboxylase family protein [Rhizobium binxianense]